MSDDKQKSICIIATKGTLDMAYPPLILATTAIAMDMKASIFFTFYGLDIIKKGASLGVAPLANPAAPMPIPNIIGVLPGMTMMATMMMKSWMGNANVAKLDKLLDICVKEKMLMIGCQMTMDVMGVKKEQFIDGITIGGAGMYLDTALDADINLAF
ncbi:MAG: DsrE/DsrF/DrsH-like family protein [Candidatus Desulfatibia sp.]|uniref:DsrE/DsrF/DrsH-like family protein n=1 Tax=Candidatus Desulfatibia sp. TaxID=3101189 RepID=UPI002F2F7FEB